MHGHMNVKFLTDISGQIIVLIIKHQEVQIFLDLLTDRLSRNAGTELALDAACIPRTVQI
jgi:hypothetical protein